MSKFPKSAGERPSPLYMQIARRIVAAIDRGELPAGAVVTEEPIARAFGTSRTPVRAALADLGERGLIERFNGRGFVVAGGTGPVRLPLTDEMFGLPEPVAADQATAAVRIGRDFEAALVHALPFGAWRVSEQSAADHFDVSRTVVRELLSRFQDRGIVRKHTRSHWVVGPLTAREIAHYFAIRARLEPLALLESAPRTPASEIAAIRARLETGEERCATLDADGIDALEADLHDALLARGGNPHLERMLRQCHLPRVVNRVFVSFVGAAGFAPALREHMIVLDFVVRGAFDAAAAALEEHLWLSAARTRRRLMAVSVFPEPDLPPFLARVAADAEVNSLAPRPTVGPGNCAPS